MSSITAYLFVCFIVLQQTCSFAEDLKAVDSLPPPPFSSNLRLSHLRPAVVPAAPLTPTVAPAHPKHHDHHDKHDKHDHQHNHPASPAGHLRPVDSSRPVDSAQSSASLLGIKASKDLITISGAIAYDPRVSRLPVEWYMTVKLEDISLSDAPSKVIATVSYPTEHEVLTMGESGKLPPVAETGNPMALGAAPRSYALSFPRSRLPVTQQRIYSVSAVLNIGWSPRSDHYAQTHQEWIRPGDYFTTERFPVEFAVNGDGDEMVDRPLTLNKIPIQ